MQKIFMLCMHVFGIPCCTVLTVHSSGTMIRPYKTNCVTHKSLPVQKPCCLYLRSSAILRGVVW
jgi:hypothetical protein